MWKDYSVSFIRSNRESSISVIAASLIAALFLSLICTLFFNFWTYEIMVTIKNMGISEFEMTEDLQGKRKLGKLYCISKSSSSKSASK